MALIKTGTITVIRMDDVVFTYPDATVSVREGVLHITQYNTKGTPRAQHHHPLTNIWDWYPEGQDNG